MLKFSTRFFLALALVAFGRGESSRAYALERPGEELQQVGLTTKLGAQVDLSLEFTDSSGQRRALSSFTRGDRPIAILPVYYECPRMCGLAMNGAAAMLNELSLRLGEDFDLLTVSFDAQDTPARAAERAANYWQAHRSPEDARRGWHFLVGEQANIDALMSQIGFNYMRDGGEWAHTSALMLLTPDGKVSQYFTGIQFSAPDVRLALVEASQGKIGTVMDHIMLFCFRFDPTKGKYTWVAFNTLRAGGALTLGLLAFLVISLIRKGRSTSAQST